MTNEVSVDETRKNLSTIINKAQYGRERFLVKKNNKPAVIILSIEDFEDNIIPELKLLPKKEITQEIRRLVRESRKKKSSEFINI